MTTERIDAVQVQFNVKYEAAKKIRTILDPAAEQCGLADSVESEVVYLVAGET